MARTKRLSAAAAAVLCVVGIQWNGVVLAAEEPLASGAGAAAAAVSVASEAPRLVIDPSRYTLADDSGVFAQRRGRFFGRGDRNEGARAAIVVGTIAAITGAALLVYANRPECGTNPSAGGCSYGTKVVGGAVLAAGAVGIVAGTVSWR